jgi:CRISPR-associated protein Csx17
LNHIVLAGCTSEPFSSYLSGLAVLRLVCEQKDPDVRGWWGNDCFQLGSNLNNDDLITFFLNEYIPTPIVSPWRRGSGFYEGDNTVGIDAILKSDSERFIKYRESIEKIKSFPEMPLTNLPLGVMLDILEDNAKGKAGKTLLELVNETREKVNLVSPIIFTESSLNLTIEDLEERTKQQIKSSQEEKEWIKVNDLIKSAKLVRTQVKGIKRDSREEQIIRACRDRLDECVVEWIDATAVIGPSGEAKYPPIMGTGGNEGRLDYSNNFMKFLSSMLLSNNSESSRNLLRNALFCDPTDNLQKAHVGQYDPGRAGGFNQGHGFVNKDFPVNPWSFILTMEGTIPWVSSISRRQRTIGKEILISSFTVKSTPVGYASSCDKDTKNARAEIWAPLWNQPTGYHEIRSFLSEGRADVGRRPASNGIEFAEAVSSLGVDRGVSEFIRFSLLQWRGDSYIALPAGRFPVQIRTESDLIRELNPLLRSVDGFLKGFKGEGPPARFSSARRCVDEAIYTTLLHGGATNVKYLVAALGRLERLIAQRGLERDPKLSHPISGLSPRWIAAADDGSIEVRIAAALASIGPTGDVGPIRSNLAPIDPKKPWTWGTGRGQTAWEGNSLVSRLASVLARRMMDAHRVNTEYNPLWGALQLSPKDICALIVGEIDEPLVEDLLFGFTWIRWVDTETVRKVQKDLMMQKGWGRPTADHLVPRSFALLKLLFLPGEIERNGEMITIKPEPSIIPRMRAGHIHDACKVAGRRLTSVSLIPITTDFPDGIEGIRIAAALLLPIRGEKEIMNLILRPQEGKK